MKALPLQCPHCGQSLTAMRFGVAMRPIWLRIFDAVKRAGAEGISFRDLHALIYGDRKVTRQALSVQVSQMNSALAATDVRVRFRDHVYRVVHEQTRAVA